VSKIAASFLSGKTKASFHKEKCLFGKTIKAGKIGITTLHTV
jgi:hypothetical protein